VRLPAENDREPVSGIFLYCILHFAFNPGCTTQRMHRPAPPHTSKCWDCTHSARGPRLLMPLGRLLLTAWMSGTKLPIMDARYEIADNGCPEVVQVKKTPYCLSNLPASDNAERNRNPVISPVFIGKRLQIHFASRLPFPVTFADSRGHRKPESGPRQELPKVCPSNPVL
jgi:hypothetical protein